MLKVVGYAGNAEVQIRHAVMFMMNEILERQDSAFLDSVNSAVMGQLDMGAHVSQQLWGMISVREPLP